MKPETQSETHRDSDPAPALSLKNADSIFRAEAATQAAIDKKGERIVLLDLTALSSFTSYFMIASGTSTKQVQSIADSIQDRMKAEGLRPITVSGTQEGRWIVLDYGDVVAHVFLDAIRDFYRLEDLWAKARRVPIPTEWYLSPSRALT